METKVITPEELVGRPLPSSPFMRQGIGSVELPLYPGAEDAGRPVAVRHYDPPLRSRRIALVGFAESRHEAPYEDPDVEIWTMNQTSMLMPRWDRLIECHDRPTIEAETAAMKRVANYLARLQAERDRPIYMQDVVADIPNSVRLPVEHLAKCFSEHIKKIEGGYVESALGWMLALAIDKLMTLGPALAEEVGPRLGWIGVYGFDLTSDSEYGLQRPNGEFYLGFAAALGIEVFVPPSSALLSSEGLYGFTTNARRSLLYGMKAEHEARMLELDKEIAARNEIIASAHQEIVRFTGMRDQAAWSQAYLASLLRGGAVTQ